MKYMEWNLMTATSIRGTYWIRSWWLLFKEEERERGVEVGLHENGDYHHESL